jgi:hypothetical protein
MIIKHSSRHGHMGLAGEDGGYLKELKIGDDILTTESRDGKFDAMICWWEFTEEFLAFEGPKLFYCCEPSFYFRGWRSSKIHLRRGLHSLRADEFAWHFHENSQMRVEHETSAFSDKNLPLGDHVIPNAATVLGNLGRPIFRNKGRQKRLKFIIESGCHIYGPNKNWGAFQLKLFSKKGFPVGYQGECSHTQKISILSKYHACICFENSSEPEYFTEKFPDAVRAGCVPIYHPHPAVRDKFLAGAIWVDPVDYGLDARATMEAALKLERKEVAAQNLQWLRNNANLQQTKVEKIYEKLAGILRKKMSGSISLPERATRANLPDEYFLATHGRCAVGGEL